MKFNRISHPNMMEAMNQFVSDKAHYRKKMGWELLTEDEACMIGEAFKEGYRKAYKHMHEAMTEAELKQEWLPPTD